MRIAYVAKHGSGGNDDEGAVAFALGRLGHDVLLVPEQIASPSSPMFRWPDADLCLFHKWDNPDGLRKVPYPKVFWYFDLVCTLDESIRRRQEARQDWMKRITPLVDLGFCTDGDWVARDKTGKLAVLRQGADERIVGRGTKVRDVPILFTGNSGGHRQQFVDEMFAKYGDKFLCVRDGVYRESLRDLIADTMVCVCPDFPVTDRYWSNRVYNAAGFGACIVHPHCDDLLREYNDRTIVYYRTRTEMHAAIDCLLNCLDGRQRMSEASLEQTENEHLYRHRCARLVATVKERLKI